MEILSGIIFFILGLISSGLFFIRKINGVKKKIKLIEISSIQREQELIDLNENFKEEIQKAKASFLEEIKQKKYLFEMKAEYYFKIQEQLNNFIIKFENYYLEEIINVFKVIYENLSNGELNNIKEIEIYENAISELNNTISELSNEICVTLSDLDTIKVISDDEMNPLLTEVHKLLNSIQNQNINLYENILRVTISAYRSGNVSFNPLNEITLFKKISEIKSLNQEIVSKMKNKLEQS